VWLWLCNHGGFRVTVYSLPWIRFVTAVKIVSGVQLPFQGWRFNVEFCFARLKVFGQSTSRALQPSHPFGDAPGSWPCFMLCTS